MLRTLCLAGVALLVVGVLIVPSLRAQQINATLSGVVTDESGAVVPNASISVTRVETGEARKITSDASGYYTVPQLPIGEYRLEVQAAGFQQEVVTGIKLQVGQNAVVNVGLKVGAVTEQVQVSSEAPLVDTSSVAISGVVSSEQLAELPINGRDYMQLAKDQQGVSWYRDSSSSQTTGIGQRISIGGARDNENLFLMDGTIINDVSNSTPGGADQTTLGMETVREFQILTDLYSVEFGRDGGGVINVVTKSGTNSLHGTAYEYIRNSVLDAKNFFTTPTQSISPFKRNQFGAALSGPIRKNKTFFMFNYEGLRERLGLTDTATVPTAAARMGNLPSGTVAVNSAMLPYLALYPLPNSTIFTNGTGFYVSQPSQPTDENFLVARVDQQISAKDSIFARYTRDFSYRDVPDAEQLFANNTFYHDQYVTLEEDHTFSPKLLNTARLGFSRSYSNNYFGTIQQLPASLSFVPGQPMGQIGVTGTLSALGTPTLGPRAFAYNIWDLQDHVILTMGRHTLKFGANFNRYEDNENSSFEQAGTYTFPNYTAFLQDKPSTVEVQLPGTDAIRGIRQSLAGMYAEDTFRASAHFTFTMGLRYEFITVPTEQNGKLANLRSITDPSTTNGPFFRNPSLRNFAPRVGVAWDPFGDGKTSVRLGGGIYYDEVTSVYTVIPFTREPPIFEQADISNPPFPNLVPALTGATPVLRLNQINYNLQTPMKMQYSLNIQRQLPGGFMFNVGYVGSQSRHLIVNSDESNTGVPVITGSPDSDASYFYPAGEPRQNPNFANIGRRASDGNSSYNALQAGINRRFTHKVLLQVSYTYSKTLTDGDIVVAATSDANAFTIENPWHYDRGLSQFNIKHNLVINHVISLPFGTGQKLGSDAPTAVRAIISNWNVDGILSVDSGMPFTPTLGFDQAREHVRSGGEGERPNIVPGCTTNPIVGKVSEWYNPACFSVPAPGTYGNLGVNTLIGPGLVNYDFSVTRQFHFKSIGEASSLEFRSEFFNLFNHPNFGVPGSTVFVSSSSGTTVNPGLGATVSSTAGVISSTVTPARTLQFGLKYSF